MFCISFGVNSVALAKSCSKHVNISFLHLADMQEDKLLVFGRPDGEGWQQNILEASCSRSGRLQDREELSTEVSALLKILGMT